MPHADGSLSSTSTAREVHYVKVAARRDLRPRSLPERDHLGLRLRRPRRKNRWPPKHDTILLVRAGPGALRLRLRRRSTASRTWRRASCPEKAARGKTPTDLVAHDRPDQRQREDRLPDAEAARHPRAHRPRPLAPRRRRARLLRRQRHDRRGRRAQLGPRLRADRQQPRSGADRSPTPERVPTRVHRLLGDRSGAIIAAVIGLIGKRMGGSRNQQRRRRLLHSTPSAAGRRKIASIYLSDKCNLG